MALLPWMTYNCEWHAIMNLLDLTILDVQRLPRSGTPTCTLLGPERCDMLNRDPFTIVLMMWTVAQLSWVTMLLFVQLVQISRAQTTLENMKGHPQLSGPSGIATAAVMTGSTSLEGGEITARGSGPDSRISPTPHRHQETCFEQWKRLLGVDTFVATAVYGSKAEEMQAKNKQNPFQRGCITNCRDFFFDPAPVFGKRRNGEAMLGGEVVDYTCMHEPPPRTNMRASRRGGHDVHYYPVSTDVAV